MPKEAEFQQIKDLFDSLLIHDAETYQEVLEQTKEKAVRGEFEPGLKNAILWGFTLGVLIGKGAVDLNEDSASF